MYLFFSSFLDTLFLYIRSCDHFYTYIVLILFIYVDVCFFYLPLHVLFLFSLYTHVSYTCMQSIISVSHKDALMSFVESVSEIQIVKVYLPQTLFLQNFSRVCVGIDFIVFNKWIWVEWFMTSLICSFICCSFVTDCQRGRLLEHMWFTC